MNSNNKDNEYTQKLFVEAGTGVAVEKDGQRRCLGCMELYSDEFEICPHCGYTIESEVENALHMYPGTVLHDKYIIGKVLGYGGFGVTYLAWDSVLQIKVAIKEYLPSEFSTRAAGQTQITVFSGDKTKQFNDGMEKFVDEAKRLAKFRSEKGIVKIFDSFMENGTAYIAMEYLRGETLAERLEREKTIPVEEAIQMVMPIIESLNHVHDEGIIHRDIAPDNIFLTEKGEVKLIDFGASRYATTSRSRSLTVIIKPGYSAEEQYRSRGDQGSHTDVYSVGAVLYKMITGQAPPDAMERRATFEKNGRDMLKPIKKFLKDIDPRRENAIYNALNIRIEDRTPDMISLAGELTSEEPVKKRRSGIKKIDPLTWPLWAKIGIPSGLVAVITLCVLLAFGVIGPKSNLKTSYYIPDGQTLVPDIVSNELEKAQKKLEKSDLVPQISDKRLSEIIDMDLVLSQNPDAFNVVSKGDIVEIVISEGRGMGFVHDVKGMTLELATQELESEGFIVVVKEQESDIIAAGSVIDQEFPAGSALEKGTKVTLTVSKGSSNIDKTKVVTVPNVINKDYEKVKNELKKLGLFLSISETVYNENKPDNVILGQYPQAGAKVHQGDSISVQVNKGAQTVYVISVTERKVDVATSMLEEIGLTVDYKYEKNDAYTPGTVFAQSIAPGKSVKVGTTIVLKVAEASLVKVPKVEGMRKADAENALKKANLSYSTLYANSDTVSKGKVISQSIPEGQEVAYKTEVTITVSEGKKSTSSGSDDYGSNNNKTEEVVLTKLEVTSKPNKTEYYIGETFDTTGLVITATYANGSKQNVTSSCTYDNQQFRNAGTTSITATYTERGISKKATINVMVMAPSVSLSEGNTTISVGQTLNVSATTAPRGLSVRWSSSNSSVASVSNGTIRGVNEGTATITASVESNGNTYKDTIIVTVTIGTIKLNSISLTSSLSMTVGKTVNLSANLEPSNSTERDITWKSSNENVVRVSKSGTTVEVSAVGAGKATVTATSKNNSSISASCSVTVEKQSYDKLELKPRVTSYYPGEKVSDDDVDVYARIKGSDKKDKISSGYKITHNEFKSKGEYTVTVTYEGLSASYKVVVGDYVVKIRSASSIYTVGVDIKFECDTSPKGYDVAWSSSDTSVIKFTDSSKGAAKAVGTGKATIKVTIKGDSKVYDAVTVTVNEDPIESISASLKSNSAVYYIGDTLNEKDISVVATYKSKTKREVTGFTLSGNTLNSSGKNNITVNYGGKSTVLTVQAQEIKISIDGPLGKKMAADVSKIELTADVKPSGKYSVTWSSSNSSIATVNNGVVTRGNSYGEVIITASVKNGSQTFSASYNLQVEASEITSITIQTKPNKMYYYPGEKIDLNGIEVKGNNNQYIDKSKLVLKNDYIPGNTTSSTYDVEISYGKAIATLEINIKTPKAVINGFNTKSIAFGDVAKASISGFEPSLNNSSSWEIEVVNGNYSISIVSYEAKNTVNIETKSKGPDFNGEDSITINVYYEKICVVSGKLDITVCKKAKKPVSANLDLNTKTFVTYKGDGPSVLPQLIYIEFEGEPKGQKNEENKTNSFKYCDEYGNPISYLEPNKQIYVKCINYDNAVVSTGIILREVNFIDPFDKIVNGNASQYTLYVDGKPEELNLSYESTNAGASINVDVSNPDGAISVSNDGTITPLKEGTATITIYCTNGNHTPKKEITVNVKEKESETSSEYAGG